MVRRCRCHRRGELLLNPARSPSGIGHDAKEANNTPTAPSVQVAMATIANRDLLTEPSDAKLRSDAGRSSTPRKEPETSGSAVPRFYDIEVPSDLLQASVTNSSRGSQADVLDARASLRPRTTAGGRSPQGHQHRREAEARAGLSRYPEALALAGRTFRTTGLGLIAGLAILGTSNWSS